MPWLLQHSHLQCGPLLVATLQLDLLSARLPPERRQSLATLGSLLKHGRVHCVEELLARSARSWFGEVRGLGLVECERQLGSTAASSTYPSAACNPAAVPCLL